MLPGRCVAADRLRAHGTPLLQAIDILHRNWLLLGVLHLLMVTLTVRSEPGALAALAAVAAHLARDTRQHRVCAVQEAIASAANLATHVGDEPLHSRHIRRVAEDSPRRQAHKTSADQGTVVANDHLLNPLNPLTR